MHTTKISSFVTMKSYVFILGIFLFYHDLNVLALNRNAVGFHHYRGRTNRFYRATSANSCDPWEVFDGTNCVCASDIEERCTSDGGLVCDNHGRQYKSRCFAAMHVCDKKDYEVNITSCGACDMLRLTDGGVVATDRNLIVFRRVNNGQDGFRTTYTSINHPQNLIVYFDTNLDRWVIGHKSSGESTVGMIQEMKSPYPQDNDGGMLVAKQNGAGVSFVLDVNLRLECYNETLHANGLQKRFIFALILTIVSVAVATTATVLKVIQSKRGCLYYPSVCRLRDEVKNELQPEVKRLQKRFLREFDDPRDVQREAGEIQEMALDMNGAITTIEKLHTSLNKSMSNLTDLINDLSPIAEIDIPKNSLEEYTQWKSNLDLSAGLSVVFLQVEYLMTAATLPSLLASTVSMVTVGLAGFTAVLAIGFAIVDIVTSVIEERKVRDRLRSAKATLIKARNDYNQAFNTMTNFQKTFCKSVIKFLKELADKGREYHYTFVNLSNRLQSMYMNVPRTCDYIYFYSKSRADALKNLKDMYIRPLKVYLETKVDELKRTIKEVDKIKTFLDGVKFDIKKHVKHPQQIFDFAMSHERKLTMKLFPNYFTFLKKIADDLIPRVPCYWGISLDGIRRNIITQANFQNAAVCKSPELVLKDAVINIEFSKGTIPCSIFSRVKGPVFKSKTSVLRYIAQYISSISTCYWGYDLRELRTQQNGIINKYENAQISTAMYSSLEFLPNASLAYKVMCGQYKICDRKWQDFILCSYPKTTKFLQCSTNASGTGNGCIPPPGRTQSC